MIRYVYDFVADNLPSSVKPHSPAAARDTALTERIQSLSLTGEDGKFNKASLKNLTPEQITELQTSLAASGLYEGKIDGLAGRRTIAAIEGALAKDRLLTLLEKDGEYSEDEIKTIQRSLKTLGHDAGKIDGAFGPRTTQALTNFIDAQDIAPQTVPASVQAKIAQHKADTIVTEDKTISIKPDAQQGLTAILGAYEQNEEDVKAIQRFLKEQGYSVGKIDGDFGPRTTREFVKFLEENPDQRSAIGPNLTLLTEVYAADHGVSDELRTSMNLRDLNQMFTPDDTIRYQAYKDYFASEGKPVELARGIRVASELTGRSMEEIFVVMKHESIDFGNYNPARGNTSANRIGNNYGQFTSGTKGHMDERYGDVARQELGREGIRYNPNEDWRNDPLIAPYMVAKYLNETGSYAGYVLPAMRNRENSGAIVANHYPDAASKNKHIFYENGRALSFSQARHKIEETLHDDMRDERRIVRSSQMETLKKDLLIRNGAADQPFKFDAPADGNIPADRFAERIEIKGERESPQVAAARLNIGGNFADASRLIEIADLTPPTRPKGPDLSDRTLGLG